MARQLVPWSELTERAWPPNAVPSRIRNEQGYLKRCEKIRRRIDEDTSSNPTCQTEHFPNPYLTYPSFGEPAESV